MPVRKKSRAREAIRRGALAMELPLSAVLGEARMELISNRELIVENHTGILEYGNTCIRISCRALNVKIVGTELTLRAMNDTELNIRGIFTGIEFS